MKRIPESVMKEIEDTKVRVAGLKYMLEELYEDANRHFNAQPSAWCDSEAGSQYDEWLDQICGASTSAKELDDWLSGLKGSPDA